jgi:hypothetical protein
MSYQLPTLHLDIPAEPAVLVLQSLHRRPSVVRRALRRDSTGTVVCFQYLAEKPVGDWIIVQSEEAS